VIDQLEDIRCGRCNSDNYSVARACGIYEGAIKATVLALKREPRLDRRMIEMLCQQQRLSPLNRATMVVPVPLHPTRKRTRGFNQASIIAGCIAKANGLFLNEQSLVRVTHSDQYRAGMDVRSRRESVRDAFVVCRPAMIEGEHILLVDDVFTTGATVSACSAVLMKAGANDVLVLTIARAD
jgi:ComF family protein